MLNPKAS